MDRPLKILCVHRSAGGTYGGALVDLLRVLEKLDKTSFEPIVLLSHGDFHTEMFQKIGIRTIHLPLPPWRKGKSLPRIPFAIYRLVSLLRSEKIDLVHLNDADDVATVGLACRWVGIPLIVHARSEMEPRKFKKLWVHRADYVFAVSEAVRQAAIDGGVLPERIQVLHSGIDTSFFHDAGEEERIRKLYHLEDKVVVGTVANLSSVKGPELFLDALALVYRKHPEVVGLWVGADDHGMQKGLEELAGKIGIGGKIIFSGFQPEFRSYIAAMDLFVSPSRKEGFGLVLLEAMVQGKPVVATQTAGASEIVVDGGTGFLVPTQDAATLAKAISSLVQNAPLRKSMGEAGTQRAIEKFSLEEQMHKLESIYNILLHRGDKAMKQMEMDWDYRARENARLWIAAQEGEDEAAFDLRGHQDYSFLKGYLEGRISKEALVLEIGCGIGRLMKYMADDCREVHGVDVSIEMVEQGKKRLNGIPNVFFHKGNGEDLSMFPNEHFEIVYSYIAFQHIPRKFVYAYFLEVGRVLKPGGYFLFQLCRPEGLRLWLKYLLGLEKSDLDTVGIRRYSKSEIAKLLQRASLGLVLIEMGGGGYIVLAQKKMREAVDNTTIRK